VSPLTLCSYKSSLGWTTTLIAFLCVGGGRCYGRNAESRLPHRRDGHRSAFLQSTIVIGLDTHSFVCVSHDSVDEQSQRLQYLFHWLRSFYKMEDRLTELAYHCRIFEPALRQVWPFSTDLHADRLDLITTIMMIWTRPSIFPSLPMPSSSLLITVERIAKKAEACSRRTLNLLRYHEFYDQ
jgi:hypothetical protein